MASRDILKKKTMPSRDGSRGYQETGSIISSSRSGTIVSTAYTSSASRPSTVSVEEAMRFLSLGIHGNWEEAEEEETEEEHIRSLVQEFFRAPAPSSNCSIKVNDMSVVERWLKELGVGWVLGLNDYGASAGKELDRDSRSWIRALDVIAQTLCLVRPLFPDRGSVGLPSICDEEGEPVAEKSLPDQYHLALFIQETMLKMLVFVDFIVALDPNAAITCEMMRAPYLKVSILLLVRNALFETSTKISLASHPPPSPQVQRIQDEMASLLSAKQDKATEAIRGTMEDTWSRIMGLIEDGDHSPRLNGSSDIHEITRYVSFHIMYLWHNYWSLCPVVSQAASPSLGKHVTEIGETTDSLDRLEFQMISCLEEKLAKRSQCFLDRGLRYLFLINNLIYISAQLHSSYVKAVLTRKIKDHIQTYLEETWEPVLSQPRCFGTNYSPLRKFKSAFQRNYNIQKQCKVPDPDVRQTLRKAITEKIISVLDDNCVSTPKFTPEKLEEMLQELFEG